MQESDRAESFFTKDSDIWVRMKSGVELKLGPAREVMESMKTYVAEPRIARIMPRNRAG